MQGLEYACGGGIEDVVGRGYGILGAGPSALVAEAGGVGSVGSEPVGASLPGWDIGFQRFIEEVDDGSAADIWLDDGG